MAGTNYETLSPKQKKLVDSIAMVAERKKPGEWCQVEIDDEEKANLGILINALYELLDQEKFLILVVNNQGADKNQSALRASRKTQ